MKKALRLMMALLFFVGMANAQQLTFDFEDGTIPSSWTNDATYPWTVINILSTTGGSHCIQSGNAGVHNSLSSISFDMSYTQPGYIMFDANCMGEGEAYDVCVFYIDGEAQFEIGEYVMGWHTYGYNVSAGNHTFTWTYMKDGSQHPTGDAFQIDNVVFGFGTACVAPDIIKMTEMGIVSWNGMADSYTLRYKKGSGAWQSITGITENKYDVTSLNLKGDYTFEVKADCDPSHSATAVLHLVESWENWYGFASYISSEAPLESYEFYHFRMDDLENMTAASLVMGEVVSSAFVDGYVWMCIYNTSSYYYDLCKAPVNIWNRTIASEETVVMNFSSSSFEMAYNPANGLLYVVSDGHLKSFNPATPTVVTDYGVVGDEYGTVFVDALAIDKEGHAYVTSSYDFYTLDLTNGHLTEVGEVSGEGLYPYFRTMSVDLNTDELFGVYDSEVYYINPITLDVVYVGALGGVSQYFDIVTVFMTYDWNAVGETEMESVNVYPNPAQGQFTVEGNGLMVITNVLGQEVLRQEIEEKATIELPAGMYIVRLNNAVSKVVVK